MASTKIKFTYITPTMKYPNCYLYTRDDHLNVYATVELNSWGTWDPLAWCKLRLQRYDKGRWNTISTQRGYANWHKKLNVQFNNIAKKKLAMRVLLDLYFDSGYTDHAQLVIGDQWIR